MSTLSRKIRTPLAEVRELTYKKRDSWWTVLLVDPVAVHVVRWVQPYRWITPNLVSAFAFVLGLGAAACFATADRPWLIVGAVLFHLAFVADCIDGKVGRLNGTGTFFGAWLDYMLDRIRVVLCAIALFGAQWRETGDDRFLVVGGAVVFLDTLHHVNSLEIARVKATMRAALAQATGAADDPSPDFRSRPGRYARVRNALLAGRIRPNVISTVEFHMAVFIVAPLTGAILEVSVVTGALLVAFEAVISLGFYLTTRSVTRRTRSARSTSGPAPADGSPTSPRT
jgi:hypothetical protein